MSTKGENMYYNQRYNNFDNTYNENNCCYNDNDNYNKKQHQKPCCVKRVEETICCYPSYYIEDKEENNCNCKQDYNCWDGSFKLCSYYKDNQNYNNQQNNCNNHKHEHKDDCSYRRNNHCDFCGLFKNW